MAWLFERTVELAAWIAMVVAWVSGVLMIYYAVRFCGTLQTEPNYTLIRAATYCAVSTVGFSLALGGLACVDRFLFDADEHP